MNPSAAVVDTTLEEVWLEACAALPAAVALTRLHDGPFTHPSSAYDKLAKAVSLAERWTTYFNVEVDRLVAAKDLLQAYKFSVKHRRRLVLLKSWVLQLQPYCK